MFKKFTPKAIWATCFYLCLLFFCIWNFPIHNYGDAYENKIEFYTPPLKGYTPKKDIDWRSIYLIQMNGIKDKDYLEILYSRIIASNYDEESRHHDEQEYLSIDMEHNPDIVYCILIDYIDHGKQDEAIKIAQNTKLAKNSCYKTAKTLGEALSCKANITPLLNFLQDWYSNEISCYITKSYCYDAPIYKDYKGHSDYEFNKEDIINLVSRKN